MRKELEHIFRLFCLILIFSLTSCQKPPNYPQSLFSEGKVDSLIVQFSQHEDYQDISTVFPPPEGEEWQIVAWVEEYSGLKEKLDRNLKKHFPKIDATRYLNEIPDGYLDELQWALVLIPKNDPKNTSVIYFDGSQKFVGYPFFEPKTLFAAEAQKIQLKIVKQEMNVNYTEHYRKLVFSFYPEFYLYGEKPPYNYLEEANDTLTKPFGFVVRRIADCVVDRIQVKKTDAHNQNMFDLMVERYGKDWHTRFEEETGLKFYY